MISKKYVFLSNEGKKESEEVTEYLFNGKWLVCKNCSQRWDTLPYWPKCMVQKKTITRVVWVGQKCMFLSC